MARRPRSQVAHGKLESAPKPEREGASPAPAKPSGRARFTNMFHRSSRSAAS